MKKNLIKNYIKNLTKEDILNYSVKNDIIINKQELDVIYNSIVNDTDILLSEEFYDYLEGKKHLLTKDAYNKILELASKYEHLIIK